MAISYCGTENGRILIFVAELNGTNFLLINFHNSNTEPEQLSTFSTLQKLFEKVDDYSKTNIAFGGDFNLICDWKFNNSLTSNAEYVKNEKLYF